MILRLIVKLKGKGIVLKANGRLKRILIKMILKLGLKGMDSKLSMVYDTMYKRQ